MLRHKLLIRCVAMLAVAAGAHISLPAAEAAPVQKSPCKWCEDLCPADLADFCWTKCRTTDATCSTAACTAQDGTIYRYTITCRA